MIDRAGLADFLRRRREQLRPADIGLPDGVRRRTPGLRRDEVALLAGISVDTLSRLEQQRGANPSHSVVAALARTLRFDPDSRDHLYHLAGLTAPPRHATGYVRPGLVALADRLTDVPVIISTDLNEAVWQNALADALSGPLAGRTGRDRNASWRWFATPAYRELAPEEDRGRQSAQHVADLRATAARRAGDPDVVALIDDLLAVSGEFRALWARHEVAVRRFDRKRFVHPDVGLIDVTCEALLTADDDLRMIVCFPTDGTDARDKLALLRVIGAQDLRTAG